LRSRRRAGAGAHGHDLLRAAFVSVAAAVGAADPTPAEEVLAMAIVRSIEVIAQSSKGFDDACQEAIKEASKTLRGIRSFWIKNAECIVENDRIMTYRVNGKISFIVEDDRASR
jgi:flavin-binding protein dodecin